MNAALARRALAFALACVLLVALHATQTAAQTPRARVGYEYVVIPQQPTRTGSRIEVIEFFWYGCPYCFQLQPALEAWRRRMPEDVELRRIPAVFRESWVPYARLYYTLDALGEIERLHQAVYRAHHIEHENLNSAERSADWAARHGIDPARWRSTYESPQVEQRVREAISLTRAYYIQGTPSLVVDGRYVTSSGMNESMEGVVSVVDDLIRSVREQRAPR